MVKAIFEVMFTMDIMLMIIEGMTDSVRIQNVLMDLASGSLLIAAIVMIK